MLKRVIIIWLAIASAAPAALAFEETKQGSPSQEQKSEARKAPANPALNLDGTGTSIETRPPASGTEVRIPGLGKLGVLPKFDFGLELLYGEQKSSSGSERGQAGEGDDVQIRGSLRHRF
jgi:hypothetical protein